MAEVVRPSMFYILATIAAIIAVSASLGWLVVKALARLRPSASAEVE